ncbi:hypothetical protein EPI10_031237 [Gossypium australe]|uniref:Uncharacterized protein n=1 Tax=Gossypium australe TaxID=47621 RepID=A0A5B6WZP6_9ROSI|nr:hypothetical protein EPI10_031237 [Gossypium australe]
MNGYFVVDLAGCRGGLALLWRDRVLRQTCLDYDAILLDTLGRKLRDGMKDPMLSFRFEACWAREDEANDLINVCRISVMGMC